MVLLNSCPTACVSDALATEPYMQLYIYIYIKYNTTFRAFTSIVQRYGSVVDALSVIQTGI